MTDRLKLSDLKADTKADEAARALVLIDAKQRIKELQRNNAALEKLLAEKDRLKKPMASNNKIGARKNSNFKAVSTAPSINKTPRGSAMVPVAYTTTQDLSNSTGIAQAVRFNGDPAYLFDGSKQPKCKGDEQGTGGGIRSGTVNGEVKPVKGSSTVRIEGKQVVRQGDPCTMNGGNNPGIYTTVQAPSGVAPADAVATANPSVTLDTPEEKSAFKKWLAKAEEELRAAFAHPIEGAKGATKGLANAPSGIGDMLLKAAAEQRASELEEAAIISNMFGSTGAANTQNTVAGKTREIASKINLPKFTMNNPAQEGGDKISMAVQLFAGGVGLAKGTAGWLGALGKSGKSAAAERALPGVLSNGRSASGAATKAEHATDGVKVVPRTLPGGGVDTIHANVKATRAGNQSSNFGKFADRERLVDEALAAKQSPWPLGYTPSERLMSVSEQFNMVIDAEQAQGMRGPGGFGTFADIPNQSFARDTLAITEQFKSDISYVQRFEVIKEFKALDGPIGPQIDQVTGRLLEGSDAIKQLDLQLPWNQRTLFFKPVGPPVPLSK